MRNSNLSENAGIIRFYVRYVMIVNNNRTKVVHFCLHTRYHVTCIFTHPIFIGYWLDMEIYVRVLVRSNIARRQEHLLHNFHQQTLKNSIFIKQTKIEIQNESKPIVATSVSKAVT